MAEFKIDDAKKDGKLFVLLLQFSKKEFTDENLMFYFDKGNMKGIHPKYIAASAKKQVNLPYKLQTELEDHFAKSDEAKYKKVLAKAKDEIGSLCSQIIIRFSRAEPYQYYKAEKSIAKGGQGSRHNQEEPRDFDQRHR